MDNKLLITKKLNLKGEDGYRVFSVRIKEATVSKLDELVMQTNRSRNELINIILEFGVENLSISESHDTSSII